MFHSMLGDCGLEAEGRGGREVRVPDGRQCVETACCLPSSEWSPVTCGNSQHALVTSLPPRSLVTLACSVSGKLEGLSALP